MSRVLTFSTVFPSYHPRAGQWTHFVEKLWAGWSRQGLIIELSRLVHEVNFDPMVYYDAFAKGHTIRGGHRWKVGDWFSPRTWLGKAYHSKQVIIGPDIQAKKTWKISVINRSIYMDSAPVHTSVIEKLAKNDGLSFEDFLNWFMPLTKKPAPDWHGQIICWDDKIEY